MKGGIMIEKSYQKQLNAFISPFYIPWNFIYHIPSVKHTCKYTTKAEPSTVIPMLRPIQIRAGCHKHPSFAHLSKSIFIVKVFLTIE